MDELKRGVNNRIHVKYPKGKLEKIIIDTSTYPMASAQKIIGKK
jgi:hypothetical protein